MGGAPTRHRGRSRYPTRSRNAGAPGAAPVPDFNPLTGWTTDPVHGVWASDPLWTPPADGGAVSSWRNGGSVGGDLVQATGSKQPTYDASNPAFNGAATVTFDGTDDVLVMDPTDIPQPYWLVCVAATGTPAALQRIVGVGPFTYRGLGVSTTSGGRWTLALAGEIVGGVSDTSPHLLLGQGSGASSAVSADGTSVASGNAGAGGISILALGAGALADLTSFANFLDGDIAYATVFDTDPTALPEWAAFKSWVTSTYGITIA